MSRLQRSNSGALKEGFLVKKGHWRHAWKSRWFVLHEDRLLYFHKKRRDEPVGEIKLKGASVVAPVPEYDKRQAVFKVCVWGGKEYLLQAPTDTERDLWTTALGAAIRSFDSTAMIDADPDSRALPSRVDLSDILSAMQDPDAGVDMTTFDVDGVEYHRCFRGTYTIDWLLKWGFACSREDAIHIMHELLRLVHIQPIQVCGKKRSEVTPELANKKFYDSDEVYYRFSSLTKAGSQDCFLDLTSDSDSDSSSSGGEWDEEEDKPRPGAGRLLKQGFLLKRGHNLRRKWKMRRVLVKADPASLEYHSAAKGDHTPFKVLSLAGGQVYDTQQQTSTGEVVSGMPRRREFVFCVKLPHLKPLVFQAEDEHCTTAWVSSIRAVTAGQ